MGILQQQVCSKYQLAGLNGMEHRAGRSGVWRRSRATQAEDKRQESEQGHRLHRIKKKEMTSFPGKEIEPAVTVLSRISQTQEDKISYAFLRIEHWHLCVRVCHERCTETETEQRGEDKDKYVFLPHAESRLSYIVSMHMCVYTWYTCIHAI